MSIVNTKGVDISYANGNIDLAKVKNAGYKWVMIRCGYGSDMTSQDDTQFASNVAKAEKLGMPWGVYLFSYACSTSAAKSELAHIDRLLKEQAKKGYYPTLPVALDMEYSDYVKNNGGWNSSNLTNVATIILDGLKNLGYYPMIYTGYSELAMLSDHIRKDYDCWFAQWNSKPDAYKYNRMGMWQYGGETNYLESNSISGVGTIDKNLAYKDYPTIIKNGGYNGFKKGSGSSSTSGSASGSTSGSTTTSSSGSSSSGSTTKKPDVIYKVRSNGKWLPEVKNLEVNDGDDFAGIKGKAITDVAIKVTNGSVKYRAHVKGGKWLSWITKYDTSDIMGYAGIGSPIDAIEVYYYTPSDVAKSQGYYKAKYRVSPVNGNYYDWQYDSETSGGQDGYAGSYGKTIDRLQICLAK